MNGLTLRIGSDKKVKPIKKEIKIENLQILLPSDRDIAYFSELKNAKTVEKQVQALKELFNKVYNGELGSDKECIIDIFTHIFLNLKQKSPLLPSFLKFFSGIPDHLRNGTQDSLTKQLSIQLTETNLSCETIADYSFTISTCLEDRNLSQFSFSSCIAVISQFIATSIVKCHKEFKTEKAPIKKLLIINGIHGCVQAGISLYQKYPVTPQMDLSEMAVASLCDPDLPLDTRAASGILAAHALLRLDKNQWLETYKIISEMDNNDLGILSFCSGLLNVLSTEDLQSVISKNKIEKYTIYFLHDTILEIENSKASDSAIVLVATRCIVLISRCYIKLPQLLTPEVLKSFLEYLWSHIEHNMDAVRHLSITALSNLASLGAAYPNLGVFEAILSGISEMPVERRSKHAAISQLVSHISVDKILSQTPGLIKTLFSSALSSPSSNYALYSLQSLIHQDLKERSDKVAWFELWVEPLLHSKLSAPLEQILTAIIRNHPPVLEHITSVCLDNSQENLDVILTCLKIGRKFNLLTGKDDSTTWKGLVSLNLLDSCMYHFEDDVRLSCISLLIETSKSTEEFTAVELNLIKTFFMYNSSTQDPAVRQKILANTKKLLTRLRDSHLSLSRRQQKNARSEVTSENLTCILDAYNKLLKDLKNSCLDSLFPGSSPSRRSFALGVLSLMKQLGIYKDYDRTSAQILLSCLLDSYEDNKKIAQDLLSSYPLELLNFQDQEHVNHYIKQTLILSSSIRPPDSISAGYYMSLLASFDEIVDDKHKPRSTSYMCLKAALTALNNELCVAKESLLRAASSGPLYGHLFVIRHLLQAIELKDIDFHPEWCSLIKEIIEVAFDCNNVVSCIVYNSSPEGHIPMDLSYSELKKEDDPQVTSQMVLLCSWRTVKEVSLLLGELTERATIKEHENDTGLLTEDQILAIGEHLTSLLSETKHRGAFEQAYIGFSKLTRRLWKCETGKLHELPRRWLDETLQCILENDKLSATRRSAGIPFIVQALICSELDSGSCTGLHTVMTSLLRIAKESYSEGRLHALNILRALYRVSNLGEAVGPYVADGIAVAINGFNSSTWAERNSATLLLSALMSRVFGVPRGKSETLSWRNRMTGRLFFQRYPMLYTEILSHLEASANNHMYPALYPVLLLLGRLYPSSLEGTDSNLQLMKYVPFMMKCAKSSVMKTRALAATALASLISPASYESQINELMKNISESSHENHLHGYLLMVLKLFQQSVSIEYLNVSKIKLYINGWTENLLSILSSAKHSFVTKDTSVQILIHFVINYYDLMSLKVTDLMKVVLKDILFSNKTEKQYGSEMVLVHLVILFFLLGFQGKFMNGLIDDIVSFLLQSKEYDVLGITLEFLEFISSDSSSAFCPDIQDFLRLELNDKSTRHEFSETFKKSELIGDILCNKILLADNHQEDLVKLLKSFQFFPLAFKKLSEKVKVIEFFCDIAQNSHRSVISYAIGCLNSFLSFEGSEHCLKDGCSELIVDLIDTFSEPDADHYCRLAVTELLSKNFPALIKNSSSDCKLTLWLSAVRLMLDESHDIRSMICGALVANVLPSKGIELLLQKFIDETPEPSVVFIGLLYLAVGEQLVLDDCEEGSVFDKGDNNLNYEDLILNRLVCKHIKQLAEHNLDNFLDSAIDDKLSEWLATRTNLKGRNLLELVSNYRSSVNNCSDLNLLLPYRPYENQRLLEKYKLENIIESLNFDSVLR